MKTPYEHHEHYHNLSAPNVIVPILMKYFNPKSVIDIGCGIGTFLKVFKEMGVETVLGLDGKWCNRELLYKNIDRSEFAEVDLDIFTIPNKRYDIALCLEVAEHLSSQNAEKFIDKLISISDIIVFSAAIPNQGGTNHINENWMTFWVDIFNRKGYTFYDSIRPKIWNNEDVFWWYKQNIFVVAKNNVVIPKTNGPSVIDMVHPELFNIKMSRMLAIEKGAMPIRFYLKRLLISLLKH